MKNILFVIVALAALLAGCATPQPPATGSYAGAAQLPTFGNYGGSPRETQDIYTAILPYDPELKVRWFPIQAKFSPDGTWLIVNLCNFYNPNYCRLVRWEPGRPGEPVADDAARQGRWTLLAGQAPDKSYLWPSISWDGRKIAYTVADCNAEHQPDWPKPDGMPESPVAPPTACAIFNARPAISRSIRDLRDGYRELPIPTVARPTWRPDDKALIYWRMQAQITLASGRRSGTRSVYEYDLERDEESAKLDYRVSGISWINEFSAVHYAPDSRRFSACAYTLSRSQLKPDIPQGGIACFSADPRQPGSIEYLNKDGEVWFRFMYATWRGSHYLVEFDSKLFLSTSGEGRRGVLVYDGKSSARGISNADIAQKHRDLVVIHSTLSRGMQPSRYGKLGHYQWDIIDKKRTPVMNYVDGSTGQVSPVFWPNIESLEQ